MPKAGRLTAAVTLIAVGGAVILDKKTGSAYVSALIEWWPLLFILLGIEYIYLNSKYRESPKELRLDLGGIIFAVLFSAIAIVGVQSSDYLKQIGSLRDFDFSDAFQSFTGGQRFEQEPIVMTLDPGVGRVVLKNQTGNLTVQPGEGDQLRMNVTVYVQTKDEEEAKQVAAESIVARATSGDTLTLSAEGKEFGSFFGKRKPRMDITLTVPKSKLNWEYVLTNGKIIVADIPLRDRLLATTTNGEIQVSGVQGELRLETTNGSLTTSRTTGRAQLATTNGSIQLNDHQGDAKLEATNGGIKAERVSGTMEARTTNGSVRMDQLSKGVKVETTNGSIYIASRTVEGDWDVRTTHGSLEVSLPVQGSYRLLGETSDAGVTSTLPFTTADKRTIQGTLGEGRYAVRLQTKGSLAVHAAN